MNSRKKIYTLIAVYILVSFGLFWFVFPKLQLSNESLSAIVAAKQKEKTEVEAEQRSYELGRRDLDVLAKSTHQPENLFNEDVKVVKEISTLESLSQQQGVALSLQISGTAAKAAKAPGAVSDLVFIPYTMVVTGPFPKIVNFVEAVEHLDFLTQVKSAQINAADKGEVRAVFVGQFYIKK